jgi:hypothetical protein
MKNPEQISRDVLETNYGIGTDWEEPNVHGELGFTRAQVETDIDADDIGLLIQQGINADRAQWFDTSSSASVQHFIDTGRYLLPGEAEESELGSQATPLINAPSTSRGLVLDSESIRAELTESPESHDLSPEQVAAISQLSDDELNVALHEEADDTFWAAYDELRRNAILQLARRTTPPMTDAEKAAEVDRLTDALLE